MIDISQISYTYRTHNHEIIALGDVTFTIPTDVSVALLGNNGAGKSTLFRLISTLLHLQTGSIRIDGVDVASQPDEVRKMIGFVPQGSLAPTDTRVGDELADYALLQGLTGSRSRERQAAVIDAFNLSAIMKQKVSGVSGGQRRRFELARALLHSPKVLLLDEPTTGLDVRSREELWHHIHQLRSRQNITVIFSTHYMEEADSNADLVLIIDRGHVVAKGKPTDLKKAFVSEDHPTPSLEDVFLSFTGTHLIESES